MSVHTNRLQAEASNQPQFRSPITLAQQAADADNSQAPADETGDEDCDPDTVPRKRRRTKTRRESCLGRLLN